MDYFWKEVEYTADKFLSGDLPEGSFELIDGYIYDMAPGPGFTHQNITADLVRKIGNYIERNKGKCYVLPAPFDVKLDDKNVVQPDITVICDPEKINEKRCDGAPDWVIEILSPSSFKHDAVKKLNLYMDSGVSEYWIVDPDQKRVIVYRFNEPNMIGIYTFDDDIPVGIYSGCNEPLNIKLSNE